jgi:hypothetical protein
MDEKQDPEQPVVRNRTMEIVVAALMMLFGAVVAYRQLSPGRALGGGWTPVRILSRFT